MQKLLLFVGTRARRAGSFESTDPKGQEDYAPDAVYHDVEWTPGKIQRFWDFYGANAASEDSYFSKKFGSRIVGLARRYAELPGPVVDMGSGPGFLTEELLRRGYPVRAIDSSPESVELLRGRLAERAGFLGASVGALDAIPLSDAEAGTMFLVEVLEHLAADDRQQVVREIARVIRPGGILVATVPNQEDLDAKKIACPDCGCVFHRVQHMQSLDAEIVSSLLDACGFEPLFVRGVNFRHFPDRALHGLVRLPVRWMPGLGGAGTPHLMVVGRRRQS